LKTTYKSEPLFKDTKSVFGSFFFNNGFFPNTLANDFVKPRFKMVDIDDAILAPLMSKVIN